LIKTGFGTGGWQLAALNICSKAARKPLIADGGIRNTNSTRTYTDFGSISTSIF
jgi:GMP reductase